MWGEDYKHFCTDLLAISIFCVKHWADMVGMWFSSFLLTFKNIVQRLSCDSVLIQSAIFLLNVNISVCSSVAPTVAKKRKITQRLLTLSVEHQFVTPVSALLVESEDGPERLLADSPKDPRQGCCPGASNNNHQYSSSSSSSSFYYDDSF